MFAVSFIAGAAQTLTFAFFWLLAAYIFALLAINLLKSLGTKIPKTVDNVIHGKYTINELKTPNNFFHLQQEIFAKLGTHDKSYTELCMVFAEIIGATKKAKGAVKAKYERIFDNVVMKKLMWEYKKKYGVLTASIITGGKILTFQEATQKVVAAEVNDFRNFCLANTL